MARRRSESGHDGGWKLRVAALANFEAADRFVDSGSPRAAAPRSLTDLNQKPCKPGHVHRAHCQRRTFRGLDSGLDSGSRDFGYGFVNLGRPGLSNWRVWVDLRRRHRRTGQAQKERGPGFVGTQ